VTADALYRDSKFLSLFLVSTRSSNINTCTRNSCSHKSLFKNDNKITDPFHHSAMAFDVSEASSTSSCPASRNQ
jgi:hypothetical protein